MTLTTEATAIQRAEAAMAARARLDALAAELPPQIAAAEAAKADALAAQAKADINTVMAAPADQAALRKTADAEAAKAAEADRQISRLIAARDALPAMLAPADDEILAASADLETIANQAASDAREALSAKIRDVAAQLGKLLQQGHALAVGGIRLDHFLVETTIANPAGRPFIAGHTMTLDTETEFLDRTWRNNPEALALFEAHIPRTAVANRMRLSVRKIKDERDRAFHAASREAAARRWENPKPQSVGPREPHEPLKSTFVPSSYTLDPLQGGTVRDGTLRVDVAKDGTESLTTAG